MSYYIIIRGPLGCGKTTIAKRLAKKLGAEYVGIDEVLDQSGLGDVPPDAPCIPVENFIKTNEIIIPRAKRKLSNGQVVIFDGCFYHKEAIKHLIYNLEFLHYIFTLKVPLETCIERDRGRTRAYGEDAARAVYNLVSQFDYGININVSQRLDKSDKVINEILSYLSRPKQ